MGYYAQKSFASGEIAPSLYARTDLARYAIGLRTLRNMFVGKSGGAFSRAGTEFIAEVKDSDKTVRLIPFIFNDDQTYILEFGDLYIRFYREGAQLEDPVDTPYEIVTPYVEADLPTLQFAQSADVITIVHKNYAPRELARSGHTSWTLTTITFGPQLAGADVTSPSETPVGPPTRWVVTTMKDGEESRRADNGLSNAAPTSGAPITVEWTAVAGADSYRIYRKDPGGVYGLIGVADSDETSFEDNAIEADILDNPPIDPELFLTAGNFPACVAYSQQRLILGRTNNAPETVWASKVGFTKNFDIKSPITDDGPVSFTLVGPQVNEIRHIREIRQLLVLTSGGEIAINGDGAGILRPDSINPKNQTSHGASTLSPVNVGTKALFVQARGSIIRDLGFVFEDDGYDGGDLTVFSSHLFKGRTIVDWAYQQTPHSIVWAVRDDGVFLGLTYNPEQEMVAWHRHDTDGEVENVCVIPEGNHDRPYLVVKRTINSVTKRYIERMHIRDYEAIAVDAVFLDSSLTYDGRNYTSLEGDGTFLTATTITISGGTTWSSAEQLTLTASASLFTAADVGNVFHFPDETNGELRMTVLEYVSPTVVYAKSQKTVQVGLRNLGTRAWARAVDELSNLDHLEGKDVGVFADGWVVASPNNSSYPVKTVTGGAITISPPRVVVHVGLPYLPDVENLDIDSFAGEKKLANKLEMFVEASRGIWAGAEPPEDAVENDDDDPLFGLREFKLRTTEGYDDPTGLKTERIDELIKGKWSKGGRVFIRQIDPLPMGILSIVACGFVPQRSQ